MSPELLHPESFGLKKLRQTKESDCYALGMVIYEILSGQIPFAPSGAAVVIRKVLAGERPERPQGEKGRLFTDTIWGVLECCWKHQPHERISAKAILLGLRGYPSALESPSNLEGDESDWSDTPAGDSGIFFGFSLVQLYPSHTITGFPGNPMEGRTLDRRARSVGGMLSVAVGGLRGLLRPTS